MQSDLYPICYYLSGALSSKGDLSYRVHRLGSLQFRSGCKILFRVLPYNFFDLLFFIFFLCTIQTLFARQICHFFVGIVILFFHCSF